MGAGDDRANHRRRAGALWHLTFTLLLLSGCVLFEPMQHPLRLDQRLASFPTEALPLDGPVIIRWDRYAMPHLTAKSDGDLLFAIGLVQAHLRLTQMEIMRKASQGRLSEMAGPFAADIDHGLRILQFGKAVDNILAEMPCESRELLARYVAGINTYIDNLSAVPPDFKHLGLKKERWNERDVLTLQRLFSLEVNWLVFARLLSLYGDPAEKEVLQRFLGSENASQVSFESGGIGSLFVSMSKPGSNSLVVGGAKSGTGAGLIASDPHVGFSIPNLWMVSAYRSPSIRTVGLTFPGFPFMLLGRNERIAWGGTNGWTLTSSLYRVNDDDMAARRETIRRRWWFAKDVEIRETKYGPVISDAALFSEYQGPPFALKWVGHEASDEFTAFLRVNRAQDWTAFRDAFQSYAVSGQTFTFADVEGNIGLVSAARAPLGATMKPNEVVHDPDDASVQWRGYRTGLNLPTGWNPSQGFLVSANNKPAPVDPPLALFYSSSDRFERLSHLLREKDRVSAEDLMRMQMDVYSADSHRMCRMMAERVRKGAKDRLLSTTEGSYLDALLSWDGRYDIASKGAYAFELLHATVASLYYEARYGPKGARAMTGPLLHGFLGEDLEVEEAAGLLDTALEQAFSKAVAAYDPEKTWGDVHYLELKHPLARVPILGKRFVFARMPVPGSSSTVMKTAHQLTTDPHTIFFGAVARHISDLSDIDANYFVLTGGEDGWIGSEQFMDQTELWLRGRYVQAPLSEEGAAKNSVYETRLEPKR